MSVTQVTNVHKENTAIWLGHKKKHGMYLMSATQVTRCIKDIKAIWLDRFDRHYKQVHTLGISFVINTRM